MFEQTELIYDFIASLVNFFPPKLKQFKLYSRMSMCTLRNCSCPWDLTRSKILEKIYVITDSLVLLAGLRAEYMIEGRFTPLLKRYWKVVVHFGEDWAYERHIKAYIHSMCQLEKFYDYGMLISRKCRVMKFGLATVMYDGNDNLRQSCVETEDEDE